MADKRSKGDMKTVVDDSQKWVCCSYELRCETVKSKKKKKMTPPFYDIVCLKKKPKEIMDQ